MSIDVSYFTALWRQTYFRPNKPLPSDAGSGLNELPVHRRPFSRVLFDFVVSCLCLGIPYFFLERTRMSTRVDHESGVLRSNPIIILGACTCLVVSIFLYTRPHGTHTHLSSRLPSS